MQYLDAGLYPVQTPLQLLVLWKGKLPPYLWPKIAERHKAESLRRLAGEYGVSYEAVRRALKAASNSERNRNHLLLGITPQNWKSSPSYVAG